MGLQLITGPATEPLSVAEMREHLRLSVLTAEAEDDLERKLKAARRWVEERTGPLLEQEWAYWVNGRPHMAYLEIPKRPIISIDSVATVDPYDAETIMSTSDYRTDIIDGRVWLTQGSYWPASLRYFQSVKVLFTAGYGATVADVPAPLVEAVAEMAGFLFFDREGVEPIPRKVLELIAPYEPAAV